MKKHIMIIGLLLLSVFVLNACNSEGTNNSERNKHKDNQKNNAESEELPEDEMGLGISDTALHVSELGKAEITLNSAEVINEEELDQDKQFAPLMSIHLSVKNVGDESFNPEEVLSSGLLRGPEGGYGRKWMYYEVSEEWEDILEQGEETSRIIVFGYGGKNEYELIFGDERSGSNHVSSGNKISFNFNKSEIEKTN